MLDSEAKKRREAFGSVSLGTGRVRFDLCSSVICQSASGSENSTIQFLSGNDVYRLFFYKV